LVIQARKLKTKEIFLVKRAFKKEQFEETKRVIRYRSRKLKGDRQLQWPKKKDRQSKWPTKKDKRTDKQWSTKHDTEN
jgi:hypothetical protein